MAQKYYNTAETAKLLGKSVDDVKKMLENRELHGYRDGNDWKFKAEDIEKLPGVTPPADEPDGADEGDVLLSDVALGQSDPGLSGTVIGMNGAAAQIMPDSDINLAESDVQIADQSQTPPVVPKSGSSAQFEELDLTLEEDLTLEDSTLMLEKNAAEDSAFIDLGDSKTLEDDNLVLGGSSKGSGLSLGGDSGISLVDPSDSGFSLETPINLGASEASLELGEEDLLTTADAGGSDSATMLKADDDFMLTPLEEVPDDGSESGSQVIALDTEGDESATMIGSAGGGMAAMLDEDLSAQSDLSGGAGPLGGAPVLGAQPGGMAEGAALQTRGYSFEPPYTGWQIAGLSICVVLLILCGIVSIDLLRSMWGWNEPFEVNSALMDMISGWITG